MANNNEEWFFSTNKDLCKIDNESCGEIHTATEIIAVVCKGQKSKGKLAAAAPDLLEALAESNKLIAVLKDKLEQPKYGIIISQKLIDNNNNAINKATK